VRRLRAAASLLGLDQLDAPLKALQDALGRVRDLQIQIAWLRGRDAALGGRSSARLARAVRALTVAVNEWSTRTRPWLLEPHPLRGRLGGARVARLLRKRFDRFAERLEAARARPTPSTLHALRRSVKRLRYLLELASPSLGKADRALPSRLAALQGLLGELHDLDLRVALLRGHPLQAGELRKRARMAARVTAELARATGWTSPYRR
jgi:CHAD domain-containing protein